CGAGPFSDRFGRKPVLVAGWLFGLPVPVLLIWAPSWGWVIFANVLLGLNQGLTWSTTVNMKIDLVGPARRGLATGLQGAAGYGALAVPALATGLIDGRGGLCPQPVLLRVACARRGRGLSVLSGRACRAHGRHEAASHAGAAEARLSTGKVFRLTPLAEPALSSCSQAGLANNLNDGLAWGLLPIFFVSNGLSIASIGVLGGIYPAVWGA